MSSQGAALTTCHESPWDLLAPAQRTSQAGSSLHRHRSLWPQAPTGWVGSLGSHKGGEPRVRGTLVRGITKPSSGPANWALRESTA